MKKFLKFAGVAAVALVAGCEHVPCDDNCGSTVLERPRQEAVAQVAEPVIYAAEPSADYCGEYQPSNACGTHIRTVREPVEVVYRRTVYKTVYEPKTYKSVNYEREAYVAQRTAPVERVVYAEPKQQERVTYRTVVKKAPAPAFEKCDTVGCYK